MRMGSHQLLLTSTTSILVFLAAVSVVSAWHQNTGGIGRCYSVHIARQYCSKCVRLIIGHDRGGDTRACCQRFPPYKEFQRQIGRPDLVYKFCQKMLPDVIRGYSLTSDMAAANRPLFEQGIDIFSVSTTIGENFKQHLKGGLDKASKEWLGRNIENTGRSSEDHPFVEKGIDIFSFSPIGENSRQPVKESLDKTSNQWLEKSIASTGGSSEDLPVVEKGIDIFSVSTIIGENFRQPVKGSLDKTSKQWLGQSIENTKERSEDHPVAEKGIDIFNVSTVGTNLRPPSQENLDEILKGWLEHSSKKSPKETIHGRSFGTVPPFKAHPYFQQKFESQPSSAFILNKPGRNKASSNEYSENSPEKSSWETFHFSVVEKGIDVFWAPFGDNSGEPPDESSEKISNGWLKQSFKEQPEEKFMLPSAEFVFNKHWKDDESSDQSLDKNVPQFPFTLLPADPFHQFWDHRSSGDILREKYLHDPFMFFPSDPFWDGKYFNEIPQASSDGSSNESSDESSNKSSDESSNDSSNESSDDRSNESSNYYSSNESSETSSNENSNESSDESPDDSSNESSDDSSSENLHDNSNKSSNESLDDSSNERLNEILDKSANESTNKSLGDSSDESSSESSDESSNESSNGRSSKSSDDSSDESSDDSSDDRSNEGSDQENSESKESWEEINNKWLFPFYPQYPD